MRIWTGNEMGHEFELEDEIDLELEEPKRYKVLLLNDDYSTMEFVVEVLMGIFKKTYDESVAIMLAIHNQGSGVCGVYSFEIAETKVAQVRAKAKEAGFPLRATMEEE